MTTADTLLAAAVACTAGPPDGARHRAVLKDLLAAAKEGGFTRSRELRALVHSARKLAQEAAQHIEPETAAEIIAKHRDAGRPTLAALIGACKSAVRAGSPRPTDESIITALAYTDHAHHLEHLARVGLAAAIAELQMRQAEAEPADEPLADLVRRAVAVVRERGPMDDAGLAGVLCELVEHHRLSAEAREYVGLAIAELAVRVADFDWVEGALDCLRARSGQG